MFYAPKYRLCCQCLRANIFFMRGGGSVRVGEEGCIACHYKLNTICDPAFILRNLGRLLAFGLFFISQTISEDKWPMQSLRQENDFFLICCSASIKHNLEDCRITRKYERQHRRLLQHNRIIGKYFTNGEIFFDIYLWILNMGAFEMGLQSTEQCGEWREKCDT